MKKLFKLAVLTFLVSQISLSQSTSLLSPNLRDLFHEALSGELSKEHVIQITRHHRIQGSRGYRDAANYVLQQLRKYGFSEKDAYIESFKSDGKIHYQTWQSPSGWDITSAELRMLEPYEERIIGYPEIAMSVMTYCNPGDVTAELVSVGSGTRDEDYEGKDVKGKFVLATGYGGSVHRLAVLKYGAKAVVCYLDDERAKLYPDMIYYTGMWPRTDEIGRVTFGFNISKRQGEKLKSLLLAGNKVVLNGWVKGIGLEPYWMDVVVAHISGIEKPDEELVFVAHLDHPKESANDNASGSGAILDIARALKELIDAGKLPKPKRSFRFLWVPEWHGTMAYIDKHPEFAGPKLGGKWLASLNLDMVGEHLEMLHSKLIITRTPASLPSCVNDVVENMAQMVDNMNVRTPRGSLSQFNYRIIPYSGGSDHMMFIDRKIPSLMLSHSPDYTHHTSEDTPDKVDPVQLERCEIISTAALWFLANLDEEQAVSLGNLVGTNSLKRLGDALQKVHQMFAAPPVEDLAHTWAGGKNIMDYALQQEQTAVSSILNFYSSDRVKDLITWWHGNLKRQYESTLEWMKETANKLGVSGNEPPPLHVAVDNRVPVRLTRGPLDFRLPESKLDSISAAWYKTREFTLNGDMRFELVNFIDGKHTISEICNALSAEFGPVELKVVARYIEDLVKVGVVRWK